ncbi:MAG: hypothetical protein JRI36_11650 [Deltaproteobacteria bacterium]|nr:hypothetical protein [Deltaproteobacteria bacterium]
MRISVNMVVRVVRTFLWIATVYIVALLVKIHTVTGTDLRDSFHILDLGIVSFAGFVMVILYQSRHELDIRKQATHIARATVLLLVLYGLCWILAFSRTQQWTPPWI